MNSKILRYAVLLKILAIPILCPTQVNPGIGQTIDNNKYVGQTPPGNSPQIFAPGIISLENRMETYPAFSPDGKKLYFSVVNASWTQGKIYYTEEQNGSWTQPVVASFSNNNYKNWESFISPDGNRQFFASNRPPSSEMDIWMVERTSDSNWSEPVLLSNSVNSIAEDGSPCVTNSGNLYFKSSRGGGTGGSWLYRAKPANGTYSQVESLGTLLKTGANETEPFMAPDESYLIFTSQTRPGGRKGWDLWICFKKNDNTWTKPINMGKNINTAKDEYGPRVTPDGKYLFFTRENRGITMDIYWVSSGIIASLKSSVLTQTIPEDSLYFGQTPPGSTPVVFAPGIVSLPNRRETKVGFSPDGRECLIGVGLNGEYKILQSNFQDGSWQRPVPADFITTSRSIEPFYSPDSTHVFYTSFTDIYVSTRADQTWSTPVRLGSPVNSALDEYHPTVTLNGTLYFCSTRNNSSLDIYRSRYVNGHYSSVEKLPEVINRHDALQTGAFDPFISPDESYIIFTTIRSDGYGMEDQYISYNRNGNWTNPKNLGSSINTNMIEYGSYVSRDNKYYFFSRPTGWNPDASADVYWIKADFIDSLGKTNFIPYLKSQIPDQTAVSGTLFNYQIPDSTFIDDDGNSTLTCYVTSRLPEWLNYDPETRTFTGIPTEAGNLSIAVKAIDTEGASASATFTIKIDKSSGAVNRPFEHSFNCFPNPATDRLYLTFGSADYCNAIISLTDLIGKKVFYCTLHRSTTAMIDLSSNPAGIYFLKLDIDGEVINKKIVLQ